MPAARAVIVGPPVVGPPVVEARVIEALVVGPSVVEASVVEALVVGPSVVEAPVVGPPVVGPPVVGPSVVEASVVEAPVVGPSVVEASVVEAPVVEPRLVEALVVGSVVGKAASAALAVVVAAGRRGRRAAGVGRDGVGGREGAALGPGLVVFRLDLAVPVAAPGVLRDTGDSDDRGAWPESVAAQAEVELVRLVQINERKQGMDVLNDLRTDQDRPTRDDVELGAQSPVILLDVGKARIVHHRQHAP
ncbi:hypothetical protein [Frankia sp. QA3]|uniref:hypothetical protein n=1 Tax=Frankia sp. QA3 TaxID=710111 RepID=UPI0012FC2822|nr:hypothetical protein [Frankia sp. QA3]